MKEEREHLYLRKITLCKQMDQYIENCQTHLKEFNCLSQEYKKVTQELRLLDNQLEEEEDLSQTCVPSPPTDWERFLSHFNELTHLAQSTFKKRHLLFFGRPKKVYLAISLHKSCLLAKDLLHASVHPSIKQTLLSWIAEIEKRHNPELYSIKIMEYYKLFIDKKSA